MSFRRKQVSRRKLMLFPLMDMFFILLLYFLVTSGINPKKTAEAGTVVTTPKVSMGEIQILIQMIDREQLLWLDNTCFGAGWQGDFFENNTIPITISDISERLQNFKDMVGLCSGVEVLVAIRCPGNLEYSDVKMLEENLKDAFKKVMPSRALTFSLLGGSVKDIKIDGISAGKRRVEIRWQRIS